MADYYCDHGFYPAYAAAMTWPPGGTPTPQDGDGRSMGTAASAVAYIDCTGITAAATNTITIAGVTLTCVASGATAGQFNAGSGATLAANLVSSINASTGTVPTGVSASTPQLRSLVYARQGTNTNIVEIATRAGSTQYNYGAGGSNNANMAILSSGFTPAVTQFAGGASGPWGYFWNQAASFLPQALAVGNYGCMLINHNLAGRLLAGPTSFAATDVLWARCNNRDYNPGTAMTAVIHTPMNVRFDNSNVKWGDTSGKTFKFRNTGSSSALTVSWQSPAATTTETDNYLGATSPYGVEFVNETTGGAGSANLILQNGICNSVSVWLENVKMRDQSVNSGVGVTNQYQAAKSKNWYFEHCLFSFSRSDYTRGLLDLAGTMAGTIAMLWEDCDFNFDALSMAHPGVINGYGGGIDGAATFKLVNCRASAAVNVAPFQRRSNAASSYSCYASNLSGFKLPAAYSGLFSAFSANKSAGCVENGYAMHQNIGPKKAFRLETNSFITDWIPDQGYPTLRSTLPDGTYWSYRTVWSSSFNHYSGPCGIEVLTLDKRAPTSDAVRTVTLEGCMEGSNLTVALNTHVDIMVTYTSPDGVVNMERTYPSGGPFVTGSPLAASSQPWTLNSFSNYSAFKIALTTAKSVKAGTDVNVTVCLHRESPNGSASSIFFDPEVDIV